MNGGELLDTDSRRRVNKEIAFATTATVGAGQ